MRLAAALLLAALYASAAPAQTPYASIVVDDAPLAGFRYYDGKSVWERLAVGDVLALKREPDNPYDPAAIRVEWQGHKLGYVPRARNASLARSMDNGTAPVGRITALKSRNNGRHLLSYEIQIPLEPVTR